MISVEEFQGLAEAEIRRGRAAGSLGSTCDAATQLSEEARSAYEPVLAVLGCMAAREAPPSGTVARGLARPVWRLALIAMHVDEGVPRWSSAMLNGFVEIACSTAELGIGELLREMWEMISVERGGLSRELAVFIRELIHAILSRRTCVGESDFEWLIARPAQLSQAQAYFAYFALALRPSMFSAELEKVILDALQESDFYADVL